MSKDDRILRMERVFAAEPARVFEAWTDPAKLVRWWGPEGMTTPRCEMDVREAGAWLTTMRNEKGEEFTVSGVYRVIDPPHRLVMTWAWHNDGVRDGHETELSIELDAVDGGTRLVLEQKTFREREHRDSHRGGWASSFNELERFLDATE